MLNKFRFLIEELIEVGHIYRDSRTLVRVSAPHLRRFESRVLLSATAALVESVTPEQCTPQFECGKHDVEQIENPAFSKEEQTERRHEIVFVDSSIANYQQLLDDLKSDYGGDWDPEYTVGAVESLVALTPTLQANWVGKLATISVETTQADSRRRLVEQRPLFDACLADGGPAAGVGIRG